MGSVVCLLTSVGWESAHIPGASVQDEHHNKRVRKIHAREMMLPCLPGMHSLQQREGISTCKLNDHSFIHSLLDVYL